MSSPAGPDTGHPPSGPRVKPSVFLKLERKIASVSTDDVTRRWQYGRELIKAKAGKRKLPDGMIDALVADAEREGLKVSRREIQYRVRCAEVYASETQLRKIVCAMGTWSEIIAAGFPAIEVDGPELDLDAAVAEIEAEESNWEQPVIAGLSDMVSIGRGTKVPLPVATVDDIEKHREMFAKIHDGFAKKLWELDYSLRLMREGCDGDKQMLAVEAWKRGMNAYLNDPIDPPT